MKMYLPFAHRLKNLMPKSLFSRAFLILLMPMILLQLVVVFVFYERHWDSVVRNISHAASLNIELIVNEYLHLRENEAMEGALAGTKRISYVLNIGMRLESGENVVIVSDTGKAIYPDLYNELGRLLSQPFMITSDDNANILITIALDDGVMRLRIPKKRIASSTTYLFIFWMAGSALLLTVIATLFLRSQIRPIVQLARAAEQFGLGHDVAQFAPRGASEVRRAGSAFLVMSKRIKRQVQTRTQMLAGISHDLRTPLTRMTLEVEMADIDAKSKAALVTDIKEMQHMIDEYLNFARTDQEETIEAFALDEALSIMAKNYARQKLPLHYIPGKAITLTLKRQPLLRAIQNLIDNALRYGKKAELSYNISDTHLTLQVRDDGPGIPEKHMQEVFRPFTRLEASRNIKTGGVGLGLSIARDAVQRLGGDIKLENIHDDSGTIKGLNCIITIPV
jgi:two-component system osmolarity sensor histidine kinase EnvZ